MAYVSFPLQQTPVKAKNHTHVDGAMWKCTDYTCVYPSNTHSMPQPTVCIMINSHNTGFPLTSKTLLPPLFNNSQVFTLPIPTSIRKFESFFWVNTIFSAIIIYFSQPLIMNYIFLSFPGGSDGIESVTQVTQVETWVGKIPWRSEWLPTPLFLPREFQGLRSLAGCSPWA